MLYNLVTILSPPDTLVRTEPSSWLATIIGGHACQVSSQSMSKGVISVSTIEKIYTIKHRFTLKKYQKDDGVKVTRLRPDVGP